MQRGKLAHVEHRIAHQVNKVAHEKDLAHRGHRGLHGEGVLACRVK